MILNGEWRGMWYKRWLSVFKTRRKAREAISRRIRPRQETKMRTSLKQAVVLSSPSSVERGAAQCPPVTHGDVIV